MSDIAVKIENLSKQFQMAANGSLRETLAGLFSKKEPKELFWALKNFSLKIKKGEIMGIVGKNGAGKSTLLKILSRITEPTSGKATLYGRVTSLLEVGTGFHPELTGRENIFLNGSILGMARAEIRQKFDEIVAFAGVGQFLDTPVKHYSSGMYVRLAFAVAAHLEAEILILDEVLAVGDAEFQRKCLGKMNEIANDGRTVIFVSHNLGAVRSLCTACCLLQQGVLCKTGSPDEVIQTYFLNNIGEKSAFQKNITAYQNQNLTLRPTELAVVVNGQVGGFMEVGDDLAFDVAFEADAPVSQIYLSIVLTSTIFGDFLHSSTHFLPVFQFPKPCQKGKIRVRFGQLPLIAGRFLASFWVGANVGSVEVLMEALHFEVQEKDIWASGKNPPRVSSMWWNTPFEWIENS